MIKFLFFIFICIYFSPVYCDFICKECQVLTNDLLRIPESNLTYSIIEDELDKICDQVLSNNPILRRTCKDLVSDIVSDLQYLGVFLAKGWSGYALCTMLNLCDSYCCILPYRPEQVHLSITSDPSEMIVTFVTGEIITPTVEWDTRNCHPSGDIGEVFVSYGSDDCNFNYTAIGTTRTYKKASWQGQIHEVILTDLEPSTTYWYRVGDPNYDWSTHNFNFTTRPAISTNTSDSDSYEYNIVAFGDMGATDVSDVNIHLLQSLSLNNNIDLILHAGDISYANGYMYAWDDYMRKIELFAAYVPYMTAVGNHELFYNFTAFKERFSMPGKESLSNTNMYFSFNYGYAHIIAYSFEEDAGIAPEMHPGGIEYNWLLQDLEWASSSQNRTQYPWIILYGHRPFYCSSTPGNDDIPCVIEASKYREWIEPLIQQYNVDLVITAHIHDYERTFPVYNNTVTSTQYNNPSSATYIVVGTGGNREGNGNGDNFKNPESWSAASSNDIGFGIINLTKTSLNWNFISSYENLITDSFTITKS